MVAKPLTGIRLDPELKDILRRIADADDRSLSYQINQVCWDWVKQHRPGFIPTPERVKKPRKGDPNSC